MPFWVYIIRSQVTGRYYTGHTSNLEQRLAAHNGGRTRSTKSGAPWEFVYTESAAQRTV